MLELIWYSPKLQFENCAILIKTHQYCVFEKEKKKEIVKGVEGIFSVQQ